jgi:hypothetical protein
MKEIRENEKWLSGGLPRLPRWERKKGAVGRDGPKGRKNEKKSRSNRWASRVVWAEIRSGRWAKLKIVFRISDPGKWDLNIKVLNISKPKFELDSK